jgi:hypothetical protein
MESLSGYAALVRELTPGLWHWTARHPHIQAEVSSYYVAAPGVLIDPLIPAEGLEWFAAHGEPAHVVLTNRHHDRHAWRLRDEFGCTVHCVRNGVHELESRGPVEPFDFGDRLPGELVAYEVGAICPDETALHVASHRALACADGVVRMAGDGELGFVPDFLMDEPEQTKSRLKDAYGRLLGLDFDLLLLAHGHPVAPGGRLALQQFVER